jgi:hypothetical protein
VKAAGPISPQLVPGWPPPSEDQAKLKEKATMKTILTLFVFAAAMFAQTDKTTFKNTTIIPNDNSWMVLNYCASGNNEEAIFLNGGAIEDTLTFATDAAGNFHLSVHERWSHITGVGQTTLQPYKFEDRNHIQSLTTSDFANHFSTSSMLAMNGPGGRAMTVKATFGYNYDPLVGFKITRDHMEVVCK